MADNNVSNLISLFEQATAQERAAKDWYRFAHTECRAMAAACNKDFKAFVWAVAALSPACVWEQNIRAAYDVATTGWTVYGYGANRIKAQRIFAGDLEALSGPKVTRFALSIFEPETAMADVVVDRHAWRAWAGVLTGECPTIRGALYDTIAEDYKTAAAAVGLMPGEFQAVVWEVMRRLSHEEVVAQRRK